MTQKIHDGIYESTLIFVGITGIIHGFTSKKQQNMQEKGNRDAALALVGLDPGSLVWANQAHGNSIHTVIPEDAGKTFDDVDGFIYKKDASLKSQPVLAVHVGDCVPLLFVDEKIGVIGVAHAGWKGTKEHIAREMIHKFMHEGSDPKDIKVIIGPYIHACCYEVSEDRAMVFEREFPGGRGIVNQSMETWYVDIGLANIYDLKQTGVLAQHIDRNEQLCTQCNINEFYSFRRKTEPFGEIMGYIGYN